VGHDARRALFPPHYNPFDALFGGVLGVGARFPTHVTLPSPRLAKATLPPRVISALDDPPQPPGAPRSHVSLEVLCSVLHVEAWLAEAGVALDSVHAIWYVYKPSTCFANKLGCYTLPSSCLDKIYRETIMDHFPQFTLGFATQKLDSLTVLRALFSTVPFLAGTVCPSFHKYLKRSGTRITSLRRAVRPAWLIGPWVPALVRFRVMIQ
jgi:hypothetical protein